MTKIIGLAAAVCVGVLTAVAPGYAQQTSPAAPGAKAARPTEAPLRKFIENGMKGTPDYATMAPALADAVRNTPAALDRLKAQGALKSLAYTETGPGGMDIYRATFENGALTFRIALDANGIISGLLMGPAQ